jgi:diguanylate cyclase (GGDEF)-like protein
MRYLLYLFAAVPWVLGFLVSGRFPASPLEALSEILLSVLILAGIWVVNRQDGTIRSLQSEIGRLSGIDPLTGLGNVSSLQETLIREVARTRRLDRPLSCIVMDLDDFRIINDQYGHDRGNRVLQTAADTIRKVIRQEMDRAFRSGGDEFLIVLPETDNVKALAVAQRLREAFIALAPPAVPKKALASSIGLAQLRAEDRADDLLKLLDRAVARAKSGGKNMIYNAKLFED